MKKQNILIIGLILLAVISFGIFILVSGKENTGSLETTKDIIKIFCFFIFSLLSMFKLYHKSEKKETYK